MVEVIDGGFKVMVCKVFVSGLLVGDVLVMSVFYEDFVEGWQVFYFFVLFFVLGVFLEDDWDVVGMCGMGLQMVVLNEVFVFVDLVGLCRLWGEWYFVWNMVLIVVLLIISLVYVGIVECVVDLVCDSF